MNTFNIQHATFLYTDRTRDSGWETYTALKLDEVGNEEVSGEEVSKDEVILNTGYRPVSVEAVNRVRSSVEEELLCLVAPGEISDDLCYDLHQLADDVVTDLAVGIDACLVEHVVAFFIVDEIHTARWLVLTDAAAGIVNRARQAVAHLAEVGK